MADEKIIIDIELDPAGAKKGFKKIKKGGKETADSVGSSFRKSFKGLAAGALAAAGAIAAAFGGREAIRAAIAQEEAVNNFNTALKLSGKFSEEASRGFQDFASSLQKVSTVGDEVTLEAAALIQSLGQLTDEGLKEATLAAVDLSAALGIDLKAAALLVGKAATGEVSSFSRYGLIIKKASTNTETFARALDQLKSKFGGAAEAKLNTYAGALQHMENSFGDLLETIGEFVTKNPVVIAGIKQISGIFARASSAVSEFRMNTALVQKVIDTFVVHLKALLITLSTVALILKSGAIFAGFITGLRLISVLSRKAFAAVSLDLKRIQVGFQTARVLGLGFFKSIQAGATSSRLAMALLRRSIQLTKATLTFGLTIGFDLLLIRILEVQDKVGSFGTAVEVVAKEMGIALQEAFLGVLLTVQESGGLLTRFFGGSLKEGVESATESLKLMRAELVTLLGEEGGISAAMQATLDDVDNFAFTIGDKIKGALDDIEEKAKGTGKNFNKALGAGIASGVQNFTKALLAGENAFSAFGKAALGIIGDMAIQIGQFFIIEAIALTALGNLDPGTGLAAGIALVALGTLIKSFAGGAGATPVGGGVVASGAPGSVQDDSTFEEEDDLQEPGQQIAIHVDGTIIDAKSAGEQIANVLEEFFDSSGSRIVTVG